MIYSLNVFTYKTKSSDDVTYHSIVAQIKISTATRTHIKPTDSKIAW